MEEAFAEVKTMASPFSHAVAALSIGACFYRPQTPKRVWIAGAICSVIPDIDVIGFRFGIHYGDFWDIAASRIHCSLLLCCRVQRQLCCPGAVW